MKKTFLFLFMCLIVFSLAEARSLDISIDKNEVSANSEITISYNIQFDEVQSFSYKVGVKGNNVDVVLLDRNVTSDSESGQITWNTKNYPAGEYEAYVFISPSTYWPSSKFNILPYMDFNISETALDVFVYGKSATNSIKIDNTGNVPIFVSISPRGLKSEASIVPLTMNLSVNHSSSVLLSIEKPENNYNATLTFDISWENMSHTVEIPMEVYNPHVNITAENLTIEKTNESQIVKGTIFNNGNVPRDLTLVFHLSSGDKQAKLKLSPNKSFELNNTFPLNESVKSLEIKYIGSDGKEESIVKNFGLVSSLNFIPNKRALYYLGGLVLIVLIVYILLKLRKKRFSNEKIDLKKLNRTLGR